MSARKSDAMRAAEVLGVIGEARARIAAFRVTEADFLRSDTLAMRIVADGLLMCVLRVTEEAGKLSDVVKARYPQIDWRGVSGMRNFLVHDYGSVDRAMVGMP